MIHLKSYDSASQRERILWRTIRRFLPNRVRLLYEGPPGLPGQLWYEERKTIYDIVRGKCPEIAFEIGTWFGGGSTYFIGEGLWQNRTGVLHTVEKDPKTHAAAIEYYQAHLQHLVPHVIFHLGTWEQVYEDLLTEVQNVDFLFLDGASEAPASLDQFEMFSPHMQDGSILIAHDWFDVKMQLLKPVLERSVDWQPLTLLVPPSSVGLAAFRKVVQ